MNNMDPKKATLKGKEVKKRTQIQLYIDFRSIGDE